MHPTESLTFGVAMDGLAANKIDPESAWEDHTEPAGSVSDIPILIVDANFGVQSVIKKHLECFKFHDVTGTGRGYRAVELCGRRKFEVILVSNGLVQLEGIDVIQTVREQGLNTGTPIVFISESENDYMVQKAYRSGATASVPKTASSDMLRAVLENALKRSITTDEEERERVQKSMEPMRKAVEFAKKLRVKGEYQLAEEEFQKGLVEIFCGLAEVYLSKGDKEAAEAALVEAEELDPQAREKFNVREESFVERGKYSLRKKGYVGAKAEFQAAITLNRESVPALIGLGEAHYGLKEDMEAHQILGRVMETSSGVGPEDPATLKKMALIACRNRQFDIAWRAIDRALEIFPDDGKLYYLKAIAYMAEGRIEHTIPYLEQALYFNPELTEAQKLVEKVQGMLEQKRAQDESKEGSILDDFLIH
jgi:tetratricopeptide (TPR) repeat protein